MNRIEIRGVIVPSEYDIEWTQEYIKNGVITPESFFRKNLKEASTGEPLEIYINSPGGSVFAAYEMVNAVREWKVANKQTANIIIGAMAASAASMFTVFVGSSARAHKNAKMMFHGASSAMSGGKEAFEDEAKLLGKINAEIQSVLITKHKMNPEIVAGWFGEGRMGWLTADEMLKAGIISEIIPDDSEVIKFDPAVIKAIDSRGLDIAALLEDKQDGNGKPAENGSPNTPASTTVGAGLPNNSTNQAGDEHKRGYEEGKTATETDHAAQLVIIADKTKALTEKHDALDVLQRKTQGERDSARAQVDKLTLSLKESTEKLEQLLAGGMNFSPSIETFAEALKECDGDYAEARKKFPDLFTAQREQDKANRK